MTKTKTTLLFLIAVVVQLAIVALVPAKQIYARMTGRLITLKIAPIDPYNILSGHYMTLGYDISRLPQNDKTYERLREIPVYVVLKKDPNQLWVMDSIHKQWPTDVSPDKIVIRGRASYGRIEYGIESYFVPEDKRRQIADNFRRNRDNSYAQVKADRFGNAALIRLLLGDNTYEY
jgi:uncharacterized membrane-anchored protein